MFEEMNKDKLHELDELDYWDQLDDLLMNIQDQHSTLIFKMNIQDEYSRLTF